jgi:quinol monooxygenase YgiN
MLLIVGTFRIKPEMLSQARRAMESMIAASRKEAGCIQYSYAEDILEAGLIHVIKAWRDSAALGAHFASAHIARWRSTWPALGIADRDLTLHEVSSSRPT